MKKIKPLENGALLNTLHLPVNDQSKIPAMVVHESDLRFVLQYAKQFIDYWLIIQS